MVNKITRSGIGLLLAFAGGMSIASTATEKEMLFRVMLDDREIGMHSFRVMRDADREIVEINADFDIRFFAIPFYTYDHDNRETWKNGCLDSIDSSTDDNGDEFRVEGRDRGSRFELDTRDGQQQLEVSCVMTFAYWNSDILRQSKLLNAQNGEYLPVEVKAEGIDELKLEQRNIPAMRYRLRNPEHDIDITIWYGEESGQWISLESRVEGGRVIRYLPIDRGSLLPRAALGGVGLPEPRR